MEKDVEESFSQLEIEDNDGKITDEKDKLRQSIWSKLDSKKLIRSYPPSCVGKIPNFKGNQYAAERVTKLREFRNAKVIKINPSLAQMTLRQHVMNASKILIVPTPALTAYDGTDQDENDPHFCYLLDGSKMSDSVRKKAMTKKGSIAIGEPLLDDWSKCPHVDLVVVGSVAVTSSGRRLGKGLGYAEIEWAILYELGVVDQSTIVITTVHEAQIVSDKNFSINLQKSHDLPVDIIVTPRRIINVRPKMTKPSCGILWDHINKNHLSSLSILKLIKDRI